MNTDYSLKFLFLAERDLMDSSIVLRTHDWLIESLKEQQ